MPLEAKDFVGRASADWGLAAIAAGEAEQHALAAAEAARKFYPGEMPPPQM